jgi:CRISPR-associated protein Csb1
MESLSIDMLSKAVAGEYAGIRRITTLYPAGDPKIFPPTYEGGEYAVEARKVRRPDGIADLETVLLDSVQSQANRMELALLRAYDGGKIRFPMVQIDFADGEADPMLTEIGRLTALEVPHRITDALFRDSEYGGTRFRQSAKGKQLDSAKSTNATPVFELCPPALVFGFWDSTGPRGGLGAKVQRALVSEIVGYDCEKGRRPASRIDPVVSEGVEIYAKPGGGYTTEADEAVKGNKGEPVKYGRKGKASEVNLGNVTPSLTHEDKDSKKQVDNHGGVTIAWAEQTVVISLAALRRLRFPINGATQPNQHEIDNAARTVLAALALAAVCSFDQDGFDLRSRCLLDGKPGMFQFVGRGEAVDFGLDAEQSYKLFTAAAADAAGLGLPWPTDPLTLNPSMDLKSLVKKSRLRSMAAAAE